MWRGANYCRGLVLLRCIEDQPGLSAWELSQQSGIPYTDITRGLAKLREYGLVRTIAEERVQGGHRLRYWAADGTPSRRVEGLNA